MIKMSEETPKRQSGKKRKALGSLLFHNYENYDPGVSPIQNRKFAKKTKLQQVTPEVRLVSSEDSQSVTLSVSDLLQIYAKKVESLTAENSALKEDLESKDKANAELEAKVKRLTEEVQNAKKEHSPCGKSTYKAFEDYSIEYITKKKAKVKKWYMGLCSEGLPESWKPLKVIAVLGTRFCYLT